MPTSFTSSYLIPAVLLNPLVLLHGINTFAAHFVPSAMRTMATSSLHSTFETLGPPGNRAPYLDMNKDNALCWRYTAIMVVVQVLAYSKICDNREIRKLAKAARRKEMERLAALKGSSGQGVRVVESIPEQPKYSKLKADGRARIDGSGNITPESSVGSASPLLRSETDGLTDTSEEETII